MRKNKKEEEEEIIIISFKADEELHIYQ